MVHTVHTNTVAKSTNAMACISPDTAQNQILLRDTSNLDIHSTVVNKAMFKCKVLTRRKYSAACVKLSIVEWRHCFVSSVLVSNMGAVPCCAITASNVCTLLCPSLSHKSATSLNIEKCRATRRNSSRSSGQCCFRKSNRANFRFGTWNGQYYMSLLSDTDGHMWSILSNSVPVIIR